MGPKSSKWLLALSVVMAFPLLFMGKLDAAPAAACFGLVVVAVVLNRLDSRGKGLKVRVRAPSGLGVELSSPGEDEPSQKD